MKVRAVKSYVDTMLNRVVRVDEEFDVSAARGKKLLDKKVAVEAELSPGKKPKAEKTEKDQ